uniref:Uncharacterized protein n=1 Tax=Kalanchoe fedtschenkoi TaxID=63787 RepID=A0A7N0TLI6_KALFE
MMVSLPSMEICELGVRRWVGFLKRWWWRWFERETWIWSSGGAWCCCRRFMSAGLNLNSVSVTSASRVSALSSSAAARSVSGSCFGFNRFNLCSVKQGRQLSHCSDSMRVWPKRNSSGAECFNGFHIGRFFYLVLLLRLSIT